MSLVLSSERKAALDTGFQKAFAGVPARYFSAPGRTELSGNHTDHQRGTVLAAAVDMDVRAAVRCNGTDIIRILSKDYPLFQVCLSYLAPQAEEVHTTSALIRGVAAKFIEMGCPVAGFDAYIESDVPPGSGLSSSAAFEVLLCTVINSLFWNGKLPAQQLAIIAQYAEREYFGKPCGLMDQMASAVGGVAMMDFEDETYPKITQIDFDAAGCGHALCIIDSRADHAQLTDAYAAIVEEMKQVSACFGKAYLRQVAPETFFENIPVVRSKCGDRAVMRAIHFFQEQQRVQQQAAALKAGNFGEYLRLMRESGYSSFMYLQNVILPGDPLQQALALTLALCQKLLGDRGGFRVHGGGFAGTVQAFVPLDMLEGFRTGMDAVLGLGACRILQLRSQGGTELFTK